MGVTVSTAALFQDVDRLQNEVETVARAGAQAIMPYWRSLGESQVSEKARNDLVTAADHASEEAIVGAIRSRFPDHRVLAEEAGLSGPSDSGPLWIVDPLDGTTNFVHGVPQFAVSVAVALQGEVRAGVVLDPLKGDLFRAARGAGASWNGRRCRVTGRSELAGSLLATGFPFRAHHLLDLYLAIFRDAFLRAKAIRRPGAAALDLAYTACGIFDGFFEFQLSPWDIAAGGLLVVEAGGVMTDMEGREDFLFSGDVVCGSPAVHAELLEIVGRHRASWKRRIEEGSET